MIKSSAKKRILTGEWRMYKLNKIEFKAEPWGRPTSLILAMGE